MATVDEGVRSKRKAPEGDRGFTLDDLSSAIRRGSAQPDPPGAGPTPSRTEAVGGGAEADGPAARDAMGFSPYVSGLARFLRESQDGLTVSIEGEWGSGKSSFMNQLATELDDESTLVVRFNPWHHDDLKTLSAAFTEAFVKAARDEMRKDHLVRASPAPRLDRVPLLAPLRAWLLRTRYGLHVYRVERGLEAYRADGDRRGSVLGWGVAVLVAVALVVLSLAGVPIPEAVLGALGAKDVAGVVPSAAYTLGGLAAAGGSAFKLARNVRAALDPVGRSLREHATKDKPEPDYVAWLQGRLPEVLQRYVKDKRVYVLVDDLDRCTPQQAAETLLAINRIIEGGEKEGRPSMVFLLGLDREKVAAGLAVKNRDVLAFLGEDAPDDETPAARERRLRRDGMRYGHEFIEKFVQVPFRIPQPSTRDVEGYLRSLSRADSLDSTAPTPKTEVPPLLRRLLGAPAAGQLPATPAPKSSPPPAVDPAVQAQRDKAQREIDILLGEESDRLRGILARLAPILNSNPRRLKYALNLFRLRARIAAETDLFTATETRPALTFEQLAKLVVLNIRRPALISDIERDPILLRDLEAHALLEAQRKSRWALLVPVPKGLWGGPPFHEWASKEDVLDLLRVGLVAPAGTEPTEDARPWLLRDSPFPLLLKTIPKVRSVQRAPPPPGPLEGSRTVPVETQDEAPPQEPRALADPPAATFRSQYMSVGSLPSALPEYAARLLGTAAPEESYLSVVARGTELVFFLQADREAVDVSYHGGVGEAKEASMARRHDGLLEQIGFKSSRGMRLRIDPNPEAITDLAAKVMAMLGVPPEATVSVGLRMLEPSVKAA